MTYVLSARMKNIEIYLETCWSSQMIKIGGDYILTSDIKNLVKLWDLGGNLISDLGNSIDGIKGVDFSPDGQFLLMINQEGIAQPYAPAR